MREELNGVKCVICLIRFVSKKTEANPNEKVWAVSKKRKVRACHNVNLCNHAMCWDCFIKCQQTFDKKMNQIKVKDKKGNMVIQRRSHRNI